MHRVRTPLRKQPDLERRGQERKRLDAVHLHADSQQRDRRHALATRAWAAEHQLKMPCSKFTASLLQQLRGLSRCAERKPSARLLACARTQNVTDGLHGKFGRKCACTTLVKDGKVPLLRLRANPARYSVYVCTNARFSGWGLQNLQSQTKQLIRGCLRRQLIRVQESEGGHQGIVLGINHKPHRRRTSWRFGKQLLGQS